MYPLPAHTVDLVLRYVSPLTDPLPPHLVSTPLRQRHHFLQITPSTPLDYLCWPSPDNTTITGLPDHVAPLSDHPTYPTRYTSDTDSTFAHAQISFDAHALRLVFHWDHDTWKYHNLCLMPFPSPSFSTPQESLTAAATPDHDNDDSYWASYGAEVDDLASPSSQNIPDTIGEDAYWAQYASVQGSADSTVPSPLPAHRKLRPIINSDETESVAFPPQIEPIIDVPVNTIHSRHRLGLPSPNMLTHLLSSIPPRQHVYSPVPSDPYPLQSPSTSSTDPSPETTADSELVTPPLMPDESNAAIASPIAVKANGISPSKYEPPPPETEDKALTDSIKGLYFLWRSGRKGEPDERDKDIFLRIVQEAVAHN